LPYIIKKAMPLPPKSRVKKQWHPIAIAPFGYAAEMMIVIFGASFIIVQDAPKLSEYMRHLP
jgi:hypothetical protein